MSQKYEWLYNTTYPDKVQEFTEKLNITPNDATLIKQIQALIEQKKFAEANELRKQVPNYKQKEIIAQDWNTMADTVVALQLEYDSRYTPSYVLSREKPTNQADGDYWFQITNVKYFGETEEIGTGEKSPDNPYELKGQKVPNTDLELFSLPNGTYDEYDEVSKTYIKRVQKIVLNGSENSWERNYSDTAFIVFNIKRGKYIGTTDTIQNIVSNYFIASSYAIVGGGAVDYGISFGVTDTSDRIAIRHKDIATVDAFKQWLSQNPVTVLYELETPEIIQL